MAKKNRKSKKQQDSSATLIAALAIGGITAVAGLFAFSRRARDGASGVWGRIDRALGLPSGAAGDGGSSAADLSLDQPHHGPGDRATYDFRPDPTAPVSENRRDAFAPATMPNPNSAEPAM
jgi:hypothetical protein